MSQNKISQQRVQLQGAIRRPIFLLEVTKENVGKSREFDWLCLGEGCGSHSCSHSTNQNTVT